MTGNEHLERAERAVAWQRQPLQAAGQRCVHHVAIDQARARVDQPVD